MKKQGPFTTWLRLVVAAAMATTVGVVLSGVPSEIVSAASVAPATAFVVDGNREGPDDFAAPYPAGVTPGGFPTTGMYYNVQTIDGGGASGCALAVDDTVLGGTSVGEGPIWPIGGPNPNGKTDLDFIDLAAEKVAKDGQIYDILYVGYRKCGGNGTWQAALYLDDGDGLAPTEGDTDGDFLFIFDFNPNTGDVTFFHYQMVAGSYVLQPSTGTFIDGQAVGDYGEVALNITNLLVLGNGGDACSTLDVSGQAAAITGGSLTSQLKDVIGLPSLIISNCGALDVAKVTDPAGINSADSFHYTVDQGVVADPTDIDIVHDATLTVNINGSGSTAEPDADVSELDATILAGGVHNWTNVISQPDYTIAEDTPPSGWTLDRIECSYTDIFVSPPQVKTAVVYETVGGVGSYTGTDFLIPPSSFNNADIPAASCVITNTTSGVIIAKAGAGATDQAFDITLDGVALAPSLTIGDSSTLFARQPNTTVTVAEPEPLPAGWLLESIVCSYPGPAGDVVVYDGTSPADFVAVGGEVVTCTITNNQLPQLTLVKNVTTDNGGTAIAADWTLSADGPTPLSGQTGVNGSVGVGDYDLSETGPALYTGSDWVCTAGQVDGDTVSLAYGDDVTCTITNDDDAPSLTLVKEVTNDNGGTAVPGDFTLLAAGYDAASPDAGTYALSESGPAGYTQTSLTCDNATGQVTDVTLGLGEAVTCTFVNDDDAPSLTLVKEVTNDNGGTAVPGDWTLTATGYDAADPQAGTYALSESGPAGYTQTSLTCSNATGQVTDVTLGLGEDVTCTFVNDDAPPGLTLVKEVTNDNGGTAVPGDWTLTATGYDAVSPQAGTYALSESGPAGYTQTSLTCDNAIGQVTEVTLGLNETVVCTFVNDDDAPSLTLVKEVTNDNGGTAVPGDWTLTATGYDAVSPDAGTYALSESGPAGYTQTSLTCSNATGQVTDVTLGLGEDVTCTFVNDDDAPSLTLVKEVTNDNGGTAVPGDWTLTATGYDAVSPDAGTYALSESGPAGYTQTSLTCSNATGQVTDVTLGLGEDVVCTFVNDDDAPSLTLVKEVTNDNGGTAVPGDWTLTATGYDAVSPDAGTYALSESGPAGYTQTSLTCSNATGQVTDVTLGLGEDVTCTFVNDDDAPSLTLVKEVTNDNGGTAVPGDWTLTATGYDAVSPDAGTYALSESGPAGYTQTSLTCSNATGQVTDVTLGLGEDVTCTFVNDDDAPSLTLVKEVTNDNGGTAVPGDWTLTATGYDAVSPDAGTYALSESGPAGYTQTSLTCSNATGQVTDVTLGLGEAVTCTFVNDDDAPSLTLVKQVVNDNGGTAVSTDFTLTADGYDAASPQTGTYDLSETGPAGYVQTSLTCTNAAGQVTSVTLGLGDDIYCTFVNDDAPPGLTLVKQVVNDNGGTAVAADFTLTAAGYDAADPQTGTYDLSESGPAGYTQTSLTCDNATGQVTSATLGLNEAVICTFVNDDDAPSLTLVKQVTNDNGGTAVPGDFTLTAAGYSAASPQTGAYDLSELGPADYTQTSLTCDNATGQVTSVTLGLGDDVTCTFVNDDDAPSLTLVKQVTNDNGGTAVPGDFTLTAAGYSAADPQTGAYDLSESGPAGYTQTSLTCTNSTGQVTSVTLGLGDDVTCTFVNDDDAPSLTLVKEVVNDNGGLAVATGWTLSAAGVTPISGAGGASSDATFSAGSYDLSETGLAGYIASDWVCIGGTQDDADTVSLGVGEDATCTIVNDDEPVDLEITKNDDGITAIAGGAPFDYTITVQNIGTRDVDLSELVTVTDELPVGLSWVSFPADCSDSGQTLTCNIEPTLLPFGGTPIVITVTVQADADAASGTYVNHVSVTTEDDPVCVGVDCVPPPCEQAADNNNVDCEETPVDRQGDIQIVKTDDVADGVAVQPGGSYSYTLAVTNTGVSTILPGLVVTDDLPAQLGLVSTVGGAGWTCNSVDPIECTYAPALAPGASAPTITVTVDVAEAASGTSIVNVAEVIGAVDRDCASNPLVEAFEPACNEVTDDDDETTPLNPNADLAIVKTASVAQVGAGGGFDWVLEITNNGPGTAVNVEIGDIVPSELSVTGVTSSDFSCSNSGNTVTCTKASMAVGASGTLTIAVTTPATAEGGTVINVGNVESDTPDPDLTNNSDDASVIIVAQAPPTTQPLPPVTLPKTGSDGAGGIAQTAFLLLLLGGVIVLATRRRRDEELHTVA